MKKLLITLEFPPDKGGVATYLAGVCGQLNNIGVLKPKFFRFFWPKWIKSFFQISKTIKEEKIDIILLSHVLPIGYIALFFKKIKNIPYVIFVHGMDILVPQESKWKKFWLRKILKNAKLVVANSEFTRREVLKFNIPKDRTEIIYPCPNENIKKIQFRNDPSKKIILTVGRLVKRKGIDKVIEAMPKILKEVPNVIYMVIGDGEYKKGLVDMVEKMDLKKSVNFCSGVEDSDMHVYYGMCDIFAMPSRKIGGDVEGFGIVYLEAAQFEKPSIAGYDGGSPEAVINNETGFIVDGNSRDDIAEKVITLLKSDELREKMGKNAKERMVQDFTYEKQVKQSKLSEL